PPPPPSTSLTDLPPTRTADQTKIERVIVCKQYVVETRRIQHQTNVFSPTDETVWVCVIFASVAKPFRLRAKFFKPDSYKYYEQVTAWNYAVYSSQLVIEAPFMRILGSPAETIFGDWTVTLEIQEENADFRPLIVPETQLNRVYFSIRN
ncbi:MAG: hypothetical protein D6675_09900, partial [Gemmatimonadetes bacterium]